VAQSLAVCLDWTFLTNFHGDRDQRKLTSKVTNRCLRVFDKHNFRKNIAGELEIENWKYSFLFVKVELNVRVSAVSFAGLKIKWPSAFRFTYILHIILNNCYAIAYWSYGKAKVVNRWISYCSASFLTLLLPRVPKINIQDKFQVSFRKILKHK